MKRTDEIRRIHNHQPLSSDVIQASITAYYSAVDKTLNAQKDMSNVNAIIELHTLHHLLSNDIKLLNLAKKCVNSQVLDRILRSASNQYKEDHHEIVIAFLRACADEQRTLDNQDTRALVSVIAFSVIFCMAFGLMLGYHEPLFLLILIIAMI